MIFISLTRESNYVWRKIYIRAYCMLSVGGRIKESSGLKLTLKSLMRGEYSAWPVAIVIRD